MHRTRTALVACAVVLLAVSAAQASIDSTVHKNFNVSEGGTLIIDTDLVVKFIVTVPSRYNVQVGTSGGDIHVGDLNGEVHAKTSGGDLDLGHIGGVVEAHTSGGDVNINGARSAITLSTSGGDVAVGD